MLARRKDVVTDDSIQIDDSSGDETTIYDFQTDENQNERYVTLYVRYIFTLFSEKY